MWRREDIELGQEFVAEEGGTIYEVAAIIDRPVVMLRPASQRSRPGTAIGGGGGTVYHVIDSAVFANWRKVHYQRPADRYA